MRQRLTELTGVGARAAPPATHVPAGRARANAKSTPRRSVIRSAITLLLQQPGLASIAPEPERFSTLEQPGASIFVALLRAIQRRPSITTGALLEEFSDHPEADALQKLAVEPLLQEGETAIPEFEGLLLHLELQALEQRRSELNSRVSSVGFGGISEEEKVEYRSIPQRIAEIRQSMAGQQNWLT
jgi:DNA primase